VFVFAYNAAVAFLRGVIFEKMSEHRRAGEVVYSDNRVTLSAEHLTERKASDPAETVNCNSY
jgi:hypothetical protein